MTNFEHAAIEFFTHPILMPKWGWIGLLMIAGALAVEMARLWVVILQLWIQHKKSRLAYLINAGIQHLGLCGCHPDRNCKIHGDLALRIHAKPDVEVILEAAGELKTWQMAERFENAVAEREEHERIERKRRIKEQEQARAQREAEELEAQRELARDRLAAQAAKQQEREILARAAAEAERLKGNENKSTIFEKMGDHLVTQWLGQSIDTKRNGVPVASQTSSSLEDEGGG